MNQKKTNTNQLSLNFLSETETKNELELTKEFILKSEDIEQLEKENNKNSYRHSKNYSGQDEMIDFVNGCTVCPTDSEFFDNSTHSFLYIATYIDKHNDMRPNKFKFDYPDKKIGIAYDVEKRMKDLEDEIKIGRHKVGLKNINKTHTPLQAKSLISWKIPKSDCFRFERYLHNLLEHRKTEGEWFTDYYKDIIDIVTKESVKFKNNGGDITLFELSELLSENLHRFEKLNNTNTVKINNEDEFVDTVVYKL